jgi:signal peptidase I
MRSSKLPVIASIVAFLSAALIAVSAFTGAVVLLPFAAVPLAAGIGILRRRVWSAYGFALYTVAQTLLVPLLLLRSGAAFISVAQIVAILIFSLALAMLFFFAGRALAASGAQRGWRSPWIAASLLVTVPFLFFQAFVIRSGSMEDTIMIGDRILAQSFPLSSVAQGDVVILRTPTDRSQRLVKRVIGVPGDRIRLSQKVVFRNGAALNEPYAVHKANFIDPFRDNFPSQPAPPVAAAASDMLTNHVVKGEVLVPAQSYFVLGDNRDNSLDSRYWGFIPAADIVAKSVLIYDSEDRSSGQRRTRWNRLFRLIS